MKYTAKRKSLRKLPLAVAMLGCLYGTQVLAQEAPAQDDQEKKEESQQDGTKTLEKITVTGSLLKRLEYDTTSPVQVITADTSVEVGMVDTAQFLQKSSIASGSTQVGEQFSSAVLEGGTGVQTVNLRGLGAQRTAVLLNGHRPGPAGTRGAVSAFDLNVIPSSIVQRVEILKDGSSSIYGSDALAGVVNIITRTNIESPEFTINTRVPMSGGGEITQVSGATGWNFDNGNIALAAEYYLIKPLKMGDRDYLRCAEDLMYDARGNRIDREDRSIIGDTELGGCSSTNLYANTVIDAISGTRYVPSWDGTTIGLMPGYRPRVTTTYANGGQASFTDVLNFPFYEDVWLVPRNQRLNLYGSANFQIGKVNWNSEFLYNQRKTTTHGLRQFFPLTGGTTSPLARYRYTDGSTFSTPVPNGIAQVVMPFHSDQEITVDYAYLNSTLDGMFESTDTWSWTVNASYSRSSGDYNVLGIDLAKTGDLQYVRTAPVVDYYDQSKGYLDGTGMQDLIDAVGIWYEGNTKYDQFVFNGIVTGELFNMPAGPVGAAFGAEYRRFSIDDQPSEIEKNAQVWGVSTAQVTKGTDKVKEIFTEIEVPLLKAKPMFESLTLNLSARAFDYDSVGDSDYVWKAGLGWQIVPSVKLRATKGTSFRAPGLYELFLGNQSSFVSQLSLDPCIGWADPANNRSDFVKANCAAAGIPGNYVGNPVTAQVYTGGGAEAGLQPETSKAFTTGLVWTPTFAPISMALDYFEYEVSNQIGLLTAASIVNGCYGLEVYPNAYCDRIVRNAPNHPDAPNKIEEVYASYINVNKQKVRGYDLLARYEEDFAIGKLDVEAQFTYMMEDFEETFNPTVSSGYAVNDRNGAIGRPELVGNVRTALKRGDWTTTWYMEYVGETERLTPLPSLTYQGFPNAVWDTVAESRLYHTFSVHYERPKWSILVGVRNIFNASPDTISNNIGYGRFGNIPQSSTQYDLFGRTVFTRFNYKF